MVSLNWDAIGSIGEVISAAAVVVSLVYLANQLRTNTKAIRASASWDAEIAFAERNASNSRDPEAALRVARLMDPNGRFDDFSDTERSTWSMTNPTGRSAAY